MRAATTAPVAARRVALGAAGLATLLALATAGPAGAQGIHAEVSASRARDSFERVIVIADRDDDDADGVPDGDAAAVGPLARADLVALDPRLVGARLIPREGVERARIIAAKAAVAWGTPLPAGAQIQGLTPGRAVFEVRTPGGQNSSLQVDVHAVSARDQHARPIDFTRQWVSLQRTPPERLEQADPSAPFADPDALRFVVAGPSDGGRAPLGEVTIESFRADGVHLDVQRGVRLEPVPCDDGFTRGASLACASTVPMRFVMDEVDRAHPAVVARSIRAQVGGAIVVRDAGGRKLQALRVAGPRESAVGAIGRHRLSINAVVMRLAPGSGPSVGGTDAGAVLALRQELEVASATWGQCGVSFGPAPLIEVRIMSPPPPYLVALGDDLGLPASGGVVRLKVDGRLITFTTKRGWSTRQAALELQRAIATAAPGPRLSATISENARIAPGASPSVDVAVRREGGQLASVELVSSSDPTLGVRVGAVDLADGLSHFGDVDSVAGTLEERTLIKAIEDGDPRTVELIVVPFFSGGGRIGESFIASDGSSLRNVVILDRAGIRARRTSQTLAHELGHVILDEPGHPDDYGADAPTRLMDSDASDSSPFGPKRLTNEECARAIRQSGPDAPVPLLSAWKLGPLKLGR